MASNVKTRDILTAEDSLYKTQKVSIGNKSFKTPIKGIDLKKSISGVLINAEIRGINEIYRKFKAEGIKRAISTNREQEINNELNRLIRKQASEEQVNICFIEFDELRLPSKEELEYLTNLAYVHSDITPIPLIPKFSKRKNFTENEFKQYASFVKEAVKTIGVLNHKPLMGIIPLSIPSVFLDSLIDLYISEGINAFCIDYEGASLAGKLTNIRQILKTFKLKKISEDTLVYSLNLASGRFPKDREIVPAKDVLSFGYGFDVLGGTHIQKRLPPEIRAKLLSMKDIINNSVRLFNKEDYGYYKTDKKEIIEKIYPKDSSLPLSFFEQTKKKPNVDKFFNQEQIGLEAVNLRGLIKEEQKLLGYLSKKLYVEKDDLKRLDKNKQKY